MSSAHPAHSDVLLGGRGGRLGAHRGGFAHGSAIARALTAASAAGLITCTPPPPLRAPLLWNDPDRHAFRGPPAKYYSGKYTDSVDQVLLRPLTGLLSVDPAREAGNVNALDEVPDSSWFTNRIGLHPMSPAELAVGACQSPPPSPGSRWTILSSKPDGVTPGFVIRADGRRYLVKFDDGDQGPRATAADAIVSRLYAAVGYNTPCNRVVFFEREQLVVDPRAKETDWLGHDRLYRESDLSASLSGVARTGEGRFRALLSEWLEGRPLGPWRFEGRRGDDPNDIVAHEDRRELRGLRLLAAWTGHRDAREQNTLAMWIPVDDERGWIRHDFIDFGDCLGNLATPPMLARRLAGHSYGVDLGQISVDLLTFGAIERPFERERFGPSGAVFGYFNVERFDPERWRPSYPNPAFQHMSERDAAWMARIIARVTPAHVEHAIRAGRLGTRALRDELARVLLGRRRRILERFLPRLSSLSLPVLNVHDGKTSVCADDLGVVSGIAEAARTSYSAQLLGDAPSLLATRASGARVCVELPDASSRAVPTPSREDVIDWRVLRASGAGPAEGRLRVHIERRPGADAVVGLERVDRDAER